MSFVLLPYLLILALIPCCIEVDISAPSFPDISNYFAVSNGKIQLTIAVNFLGFCLSSILIGPLSDSFGRRKVMIYGNALMVLGATGCVFASTIEWLYVARFFQGIGASSAAVVSFAMVADIYKGEKAARFIALMNAALTVFMAIAPVAGGFINQSIGWRGSYTVVAIASTIAWIVLLVLLPETKANLDKFNVRKINNDFKTLFTCPIFQSASLIPSILCGSYFAYISCAAFLYIETFKLPMWQYTFHQAAVVGAFSIVSLVSGRIIKKFGQRTTANNGMLLSILAAVGFAGAAISGICTPYTITALMVLFGMGFAVVYPVVFTASMEIYPDIKGAASSALMAIRLFVCSGVVGLMSVIYDGTFIPLAVVTCLCTTIAAGVYTFLLKRNRVLVAL